MRTNIEIDDKLMKKVMKITGVTTKRAAVEQAMQRIVQLDGQKRILDLVGKVEFWDDVIEDRNANSVILPSGPRKAA